MDLKNLMEEILLSISRNPLGLPILVTWNTSSPKVAEDFIDTPCDNFIPSIIEI